MDWAYVRHDGLLKEILEGRVKGEKKLKKRIQNYAMLSTRSD